MVLNIISVLIVLALVVLFAWLTRRAVRSGHSILMWPAMILSGLLALVLLLVLLVGLFGFFQTLRPQSNPVAQVKVEGTSAQLARGQQLAALCIGCHSSTGKLPLDGGKDNFANFPGGPSLGVIYPPNLTPAGEVKDWSDGELIRAIREGVHKSGRGLLIMPSVTFHNMSDADVQSLVAYLRSQPAVTNNPNADAPSNGLNLIGALFIGGGLFPTSVQEPITQPIVAPPPGVSADYGRYLVSFAGCRDCHGERLTGGAGGFAPAGPNLAAIVPKMTEEQFVQLIRTGTAPESRKISDEMPWKDYSSLFSDDDLKAVFAYLKDLPPTGAEK